MAVVRSRIPIWIALILDALVAGRSGWADPPRVGIEQRIHDRLEAYPTAIPWTTSTIKGSPEPALPYITERVFPSLTFQQCLDITAAPGSDRLFVVEQSGKIFSFLNQPDVAKADLVIDFAAAIPGVEQVYSLAFHPEFEKNRYCYVCYIRAGNLPDGTHVARFCMPAATPPVIDVASETTIITWQSGGHNGCCLKFGPDGYLYISTGDAAAPNPPDPLKTGQDIRDLLSSILRIDVDHADAGKNYRVPPDNPFVHVPEARGEVWAYGLRNPWRMSFDRRTGDLWVGDVGWEMWEMLYRIERGGNYGWAVMEGRQPTNPEWPRGPTPILPPMIDHLHSESSSITEGMTYYGRRLPELQGMHLYGDYDTGKLWGFRYERGNVVGLRELADTTLRFVSMGEDLNGECYLLDHSAGSIHQLAPNPQRELAHDFPRNLSESGLFASMDPLSPAPGVIFYSINAEPWADHAVAERYVAVPQAGSIRTDATVWTFPTDTVLVKTLSIDMQHGNASSRRRIETQILHFDGAEWMPYTYQWNDEQTDAHLVAAAGNERVLDVTDRGTRLGVHRQTWRFASRAECQRCHNKWSGPPLGFNVLQLNRDHCYAATVASQLDTFAHIGLIGPPIVADSQPRLANPRDITATLDDRARAYLHTNCAHCHRMHAGGSVISHMHVDLPLEQTNMVGVRPSQGTFGIHGAQVISPGDPCRSVLLYRIAKLGSGRMPHVGSTEVDVDGVRLMEGWLEQLADHAEPGGGDLPGESDQDATDLKQLRTVVSAQDQAVCLDRLFTSTQGALTLLCALQRDELPAPLDQTVIDRGARHPDVAIRDLFERFLPADERTARLGHMIPVGPILALAGDPARGKKVFFETEGVTCKNCHRIQSVGKDVGPDLSAIGKKMDRALILENILEPSKRIELQFVTYLAELHDGRTLTGVVVKKDDHEILLKDAQDQITRIVPTEIERLVPQGQSLMPDGLLRDLTAQQVADLLEYLCSLGG